MFCMEAFCECFFWLGKGSQVRGQQEDLTVPRRFSQYTSFTRLLTQIASGSRFSSKPLTAILSAFSELNSIHTCLFLPWGCVCIHAIHIKICIYGTFNKPNHAFCFVHFCLRTKYLYVYTTWTKYYTVILYYQLQLYYI